MNAFFSNGEILYTFNIFNYFTYFRKCSSIKNISYSNGLLKQLYPKTIQLLLRCVVLLPYKFYDQIYESLGFTETSFEYNSKKPQIRTYIYYVVFLDCSSYLVFKWYRLLRKIVC